MHILRKLGGYKIWCYTHHPELTDLPSEKETLYSSSVCRMDSILFKELVATYMHADTYATNLLYQMQ